MTWLVGSLTSWTPAKWNKVEAACLALLGTFFGAIGLWIIGVPGKSFSEFFPILAALAVYNMAIAYNIGDIEL